MSIDEILLQSGKMRGGGQIYILIRRINDIRTLIRRFVEIKHILHIYISAEEVVVPVEIYTTMYSIIERFHSKKKY